MKNITDREYTIILETFQRLNSGVIVSGGQNIEHLYFCLVGLKSIINRVENGIEPKDEREGSE